MKLLKAHLLLVICGVVVLLALGSLYWPFGAWKDELKTKMDERLGRATKADSLANANPTLLGSGIKFKGPVTKDLVEDKKKLQAEMQRQADLVAQQVSDANKNGRVEKRNGKLVPLLAGVPQPDYLPAINKEKARPHAFREYYEGIPYNWLKQLGAGMPPTQEEVTQAATEFLRRKAANAPRVLGAPLAPVETAMSKKDEDEFKRKYVVNRATSIRLYASPDCFQRRPWAGGTAAPNEDQIFEAIVDCWIMQDIVNAVLAMNNDSQMVSQSPIKRLGNISIGAQAGSSSASGFTAARTTATGTPGFAGSTGAGPLFLASNPSAVANPAAASVKKADSIDYTRSLTGRFGSERFDVTHVRFSVDIEASALNKFIRELYLQSNAYTVLNMRLDVVDPIDSSSQGYLYGKVPVVRADILMEALFFRWTLDLMPAKTKAQLSIATP